MSLYACIHCSAPSTRVVTSRPTNDGVGIRRRRECPRCERRFNTIETTAPNPRAIRLLDRFLALHHEATIAAVRARDALEERRP